MCGMQIWRISMRQLRKKSDTQHEHRLRRAIESKLVGKSFLAEAPQIFVFVSLW